VGESIIKVKARNKKKFQKATRYFLKLKDSDSFIRETLVKYGDIGLKALRDATPKKTGLTAKSWSYTINKRTTGYSIIFKNSNVNKGENIAILIQYGHGTRGGGYVHGIDYINPALKPVFEKIAKEVHEELTKER
jgi:hypothetical protein